MSDFIRSMEEIEHLKGHSQEELDAIKDGILNMVSNTRDTQFAGFADKVWDELIHANGYSYIDVNEDDDGVDPTNYKHVIARRAYDLVSHAFKDAYSYCVEDYDASDIINLISDMTELPKESS